MGSLKPDQIHTLTELLELWPNLSHPQQAAVEGLFFIKGIVFTNGAPPLTTIFAAVTELYSAELDARLAMVRVILGRAEPKAPAPSPQPPVFRNTTFKEDLWLE